MASKRIVLKFGSGILTRKDAPEPDPVQLRKLVEAVALLKRAGHSVVVVSSGAVASGLKPLDFKQRPSDVTTLQALAAVGQTHLMHAYETLLRDHGLHVAQLLVTHEDFENADRAPRVKAVLDRLMEFTQVALFWGADVLILLTSAPGLLRDTKKPEDGPIPVVENVDDVIHHAEEEKSSLGTGGMISKLRAVQDAVHGGVECIIASGRNAEQIPGLVEGRGICTRFPASR